jgi:YD repeat-containing protein
MIKPVGRPKLPGEFRDLPGKKSELPWTVESGSYMAYSGLADYRDQSLPQFSFHRTDLIEYRTQYTQYDHGSPSQIIKHGDTSVTNDDETTDITYHFYEIPNILLPEVIQKHGINLSGANVLASETRLFYNTDYLPARKELENGSQDAVITYNNYDDYGNPTSITDANNRTSTITYDDTSLGKVGSITYGNGTQTVYDYYDQANEYDSSAQTYFSYRLRQIQVTSGSTNILKLKYEYDKTDNVMKKDDLLDSNLSETYTYDDLSRLSTAYSLSYGLKQYQYDQLNNITQKDGYNYQYTSGKPHAVTNDGRYTYTYDANGNMATRSDGRTYTWDYDNRLTAVTGGSSFTYNFSGQRVQKTEGGITTYYFFEHL